MTNTSSLNNCNNECEPHRPYHYFEQQVIQRVHHFYLNVPIERAVHYADMMHCIQTAGPEDVVYIHLNTPGGLLETGIQMVNSMQSSQAHIVCALEGEVASLGTMIFLAADEFIVHDNSMMMFHNYSGGVAGKGHEQIAALKATSSWISEIMHKLYVPFMSEDEFERITRGEDLYFKSDEIRDKLTAMTEKLEQDIREAEEAEEAKKRAPKKKRVTRKKS